MKQQKYVIFQFPNLPLIVWFFSFLLGFLFREGVISNLLSLVSFGAIFTWAWLEIFDGANNFRRCLGIVVMVFILVSRII